MFRSNSAQDGRRLPWMAASSDTKSGPDVRRRIYAQRMASMAGQSVRVSRITDFSVLPQGRAYGIDAAMSDEISLLKARYCRSVMATAAISPDAEARHLIGTLTTEAATVCVSPRVAQSEISALMAIRNLADQIHGRSLSSASSEWTRARTSVENWIGAASETRYAGDPG
jgi:hypothetical protein